MVDLAWNGITMGRRIADRALVYDTMFSPHNCHSPLTTLIAAQVCATVPNFYILEFDEDDAPWRDEILTDPLQIENGHLVVPEKAGIGSDIRMEEMEKHALADRYDGVL